MNNNENVKQVKDLIDRYVYQVIKRLPPAQRSDIEKELRTLIDDMLSARTEKASKEDAIAVLRELGRPAALAAKYGNTKRWLIGPEYYDMYLTVVKIAMAAAAFGIVLAQSIGFVTDPPQNIFATIGILFASLFSALIQAFAWVTAIFALTERFAKNEMLDKCDWNPADLPPVPDKKNTIKRSEPIVGMVFTVLFLAVVNTIPQLFGAYFFSEGYTIIPLFDLDVFYSLLPFIDAMICIGLIKELIRLIVGRYTLSLLAATVVLNIISMIMFIWLFGPSSNIWNPDFASQINASWPLDFNSAYAWNTVLKVLTGLCIFGNMVEIIEVTIKTLRRLPSET